MGENYGDSGEVGVEGSSSYKEKTQVGLLKLLHLYVTISRVRVQVGSGLVGLWLGWRRKNNSLGWFKFGRVLVGSVKENKKKIYLIYDGGCDSPSGIKWSITFSIVLGKKSLKGILTNGATEGQSLA